MTVLPVVPHRQQTGLLHAAALLAMFCAGLWITSFGPAMPSLADALGVSLGAVGLVLAFFFGGSIAASGAVALWLHRIRQRDLAVGGLALAALGLVTLAAAPRLALAFPGALLLGLGDGLVTASCHAIVATLPATRPGANADAPRAITHLNLFFALGAISGPLWSGIVLEATGERAAVFAGAGVVAVAAAAVMAAAGGDVRGAGTGGGRPLPSGLLVWGMAAVLFLYVGAEMGLGAWVSSYAREAAGAGLVAAAAVTSAYWAALALGRFLTGALLARGRGAPFLLVASLAGAGTASLVLALFGGDLLVGVPSAFATGLCFGPIWPVALGIGAASQPDRAPAFLVTAGNAGGVLFPWAQGAVLSSAGPGQGIAMTAAICAAMLLLATAALLRSRSYSLSLSR